MSENLINSLNPPLNPVLITDGAGLEKLHTFFSTSQDKVIGWDKETSFSKDYFYRKDRTWQFGNKYEQYVIDLLAFADGDSDLLFNSQGYYGKNISPKFQPVIDVVKPITCTNEFLKVGVNLGFEYTQDYWNFGLRPWHLFSCDIVERVIWAGAHSLKDYDFYSMDQMVDRYFHKEVNKELQKTFDLISPLTEDQIKYAAFDTRVPLALRLIQLKIIEKDNLLVTSEIENNSIGAFMDMHIHGERINVEKWKSIDDKNKAKLAGTIIELDKYFVPLVGSKHDVVSEEEILKLEQTWKAKNEVTPEEIELKKKIRETKSNLELKTALELKKAQLESERKSEKERLKLLCSEAKKKRTKVNKLIALCEGEALVNYTSPEQLLEVLRTVKGLSKLEDSNDNTLAKYDLPIIKAVRDYREYAKQVSTYGEQWYKQWITGPKSEEGLLHPGDGRLHPIYNQLDAQTGRSTSEKPNGQNIPQDKELRSCFEADPPDEEEPEGYVIVTADMSGAELRIIAEEAGAKSWIDAFARDEDVHSVGTEILYPEKWPSLMLPDCKYFKPHTTETVAKNPLCTFGEPQRQKCDCPEHKKLRDGNKSTNFLLAYGGEEFTLAERVGCTVEEARDLMILHESKFPDIWAYLNKSGKQARFTFESRDMFGRRCRYLKPTREYARDCIIESARSKKNSRWEKAMRKFIPKTTNWDDYVDSVKEQFQLQNNRKPKKDELFDLTHTSIPADKYVSSMMAWLYDRIERQGKNQPIQGANASIIKLAMGCGFDKAGREFLWHILPKLNAKILGLIHDELKVQCPKRLGDKVAFEIGDAFRRAAAERMTKVEMKFEFNIANYWKK
jgi:DNA polymerase I-like protein with 3'-5' exonuclease and polymerase domains